MKAPIFYQANIHGNETESTDASLQFIREVATTPYGEEPGIDDVLDHGLLVFNVTANPDGRVLGQRGNANKIDMNRDYLTQSQPEVRASVAAMRDLHPVLTVDQHGYYNPTEVDGETLPHNPGLEYDLIMPFNEGRVQRQKAALDRGRLPGADPAQRLVPGRLAGRGGAALPGRQHPEPEDGAGLRRLRPFYTAVYGNLTGLDGTTPEMCGSNNNPTSGCATLPDAPAGNADRADWARLLNAYTNIWSSVGLRDRQPAGDVRTRSSSRSAAASRARGGGRAARSRSVLSTTGPPRTRAGTSSPSGPGSAARPRPTASSATCCSTRSRSRA